MTISSKKIFKWLVALSILYKFIILIALSISLSLLSTDNILPLLVSHDAISYIKAAQNIVNHGTYSLSNLPHEEVIYFTGRMGGYELLIALFLFLTTEKLALELLVCFQLALSIISSFALAYIARQAFNNKFIYWCTLLLYLSNTYLAVFDISILSESAAVSFAILSIYFIIIKGRKESNNFFSGFMITCSVFLRPYMILMIPAMLWYIHCKKDTSVNRLGNPILNFLIFLSPFFLCESAWIARNYNVTGKFIPFVSDLHAQIDYPSGFKSLMSFVQSWGGDIVWWNPKAEIVAFMQNPSVTNVTNKYSSIDHLPKYIYTPAYNHDSLNRIKGLLAIEGDTSLSQSIRNQSGQEASLLLDDYQKSFVNTKPIHYFIYAPLRLLSNFIFHSGTYNIASKPYYNMTIPEKFYKIFYSGLYIFTLFAGLMSIIYCLSFKRNSTIILIAYVGLLMIFLCPFILRRIEYRYFVLCYPFLTVFAAYFIWQISNQFHQIKTKKKLTT
jgi:hypothetical protein